MVNIIWISFLSILVIFFIIYSIFSDKNSEIEEDYDTEIYNNFVKLNKRTKSYKPKEFKKDKKSKNIPKLSNETYNKDDNKRTSKRKVKTIKPTKKGKESKQIMSSNLNSHGEKDKGNINSSKSLPNEKNVEWESSKIEDHEKPVSKTDKQKEVKSTVKTNGLVFQGDFNELEINYLKKYSSKNRGFVNQKVNDKVILNRWIKTKRSYDMVIEDIKNKIDIKGKYKTYIIWDGKVEKYLLNDKIK